MRNERRYHGAQRLIYAKGKLKTECTSSCCRFLLNYKNICIISLFHSYAISSNCNFLLTNSHTQNVFKPDVLSLVNVFIVFLSITMHVLCLFRDRENRDTH